MNVIKPPLASPEAIGKQWECTECHAVVAFESPNDYSHEGYDAEGEYVTANCPFCQRDYFKGLRYQTFRPYPRRKRR